jgi:hypothetical protein
LALAGSSAKTSKAGAGQPALGEGFGHRRLVDQPAAGAVDEAGALLHLRDHPGVEDAGGLLRFRQVERDEIGAGQQRLQLLDLLDAEGAGALGGEIGVEGDDAHLQADGAGGDHAADIAAADQAERLAGDLGPHEFRLLPLAGLGGGVGGGDLAGDGEHHGDGVLGGGDRVAEGRVHHHDPARGGGGEVDIVDADAGAADDLESVGLLQQRGGGLRGGADGEAVIAADRGGQRLRILAELGAEIDVDAALSEDGDGGVGQGVGNQNLGHL